jgi:hypothetical protein
MNEDQTKAKHLKRSTLGNSENNARVVMVVTVNVAATL